MHCLVVVHVVLPQHSKAMVVATAANAPMQGPRNIAMMMISTRSPLCLQAMLSDAGLHVGRCGCGWSKLCGRDVL
jgi:hypothetical protein